MAITETSERMKSRIEFCVAATVLILGKGAFGQGTFQNLAFESAIVPNGSGGLPVHIAFTNALSGWTGSRGPFPATQAMYNGVSLGFAAISIIDRSAQFYSNSVIAGDFTAVISAGFAGTGFVATAISQSSLTPVTARSLRFAANGDVADLALSLNGQNIPFSQLSIGPNYAVYGGDISAFAGLTSELRFTVLPLSVENGSVFLDNIQFSTVPIPEPGTVGLLSLGTLLLACRLRAKRHSCG